jgi:hypothetical protein
MAYQLLAGYDNHSISSIFFVIREDALAFKGWIHKPSHTGAAYANLSTGFRNPLFRLFHVPAPPSIHFHIPAQYSFAHSDHISLYCAMLSMLSSP